MSLSSDPSIENLKELIDKYEHPELFSFLDDMQFQIDFSHDNKRKDIHKNMLLTLKTDDGEETGIVTGVSAEKIAVNFYGEDRKFELADSSLVRSDTRTLPLEWAIRNKWDELPRFRLKTLAYYLYLAHTFDKMQSLSNSRTQILAHQIESTYRVVTSITPRFLMADEVGLGKTIEAGLIIKEFMIRHGYNRVLIIVPASLQFQWQQEMREKFNEDFTIIDGRAYGKMKSGFPQKVIMSLDFAKQEKVKKKLVREQWDTIVFDEAHRLRRDSRISTKAYHLADEISGRC